MNQQEKISMMTTAEEQEYDEQLRVVQERLPREHHNKLTHLQRQYDDVDDNVNRMQQQCFRRISDALINWQVADVRTVPGVMYQVRCGHDEFDQSIEYQINWFLDCTETFIHNHRHSFYTYCLEGEYIEKLWEIVENDDAGIIYQFRRNSDNVFDLHKAATGTLCHIKSRHHFPGNQMHVDTSQFHSISTVVGSSSRVLTFLVKQNYCPVPDMFVLSMSPDIEAIKDEIRPATDNERQITREKLQQVLAMNMYKQLPRLDVW